jgi:hypothetical protein
MTESLFSPGDIIYSYTHAQAIEDGVLIPVPEDLCNEAGIIIPTCITDHLWHYIDPGNLTDMPGQSTTGRLWDLLWMFRTGINNRTKHTDRFRFSVLFLMRESGQIPRQEEVAVIAVCGPGDRGEPVITLMLPEDD